jgi:hypothetical protein
MGKEHEIESFYGDIKSETGKAYLVDPYTIEPVWIPKSQINNLHLISISPKKIGVRFELPRWLMDEKGIG